MDNLSVAIENAVAVSAHLIAWALGAVLLFYVVVAFVYGRLIRKYRLSTIFLGLAFATGLFLLTSLAIDLGPKILWAAALLCCVLGLELSDFLLGKFRKRSQAAA